MLSEIADKFINDGEKISFDPEITEITIKILEEKFPNERDLRSRLIETYKLASLLPQFFNGLHNKIESLNHNQNYKKENVQQRIKEIIASFLEPVSKGHLDCDDISSIVKGVEIIDKNEISGTGMSNYEEGMCFDPRENKIYIFKEILSEKYSGVDYRHMLIHEMSHPVVLETFYADGELTENFEQIVNYAEQNYDLMSQHIKNSIDGLKQNANKFDSLSAEEKAKYGNDKEKFAQREKLMLANEIMADFTAIYMKTDGSLEQFAVENIFMACLKKDDQKKFFENLGLTDKKQIKVLREAIMSKDKEVLIELVTDNPALKNLMEVYKTFYSGIIKYSNNETGKLDLSNKEIEDGSELYNLYDEPISDRASSFQGSEPKGKQEESVMSILGGFIKAFAKSAVEEK